MRPPFDIAQLPKTFAELKDVLFELPRLDVDSEDSSPVSLTKLHDYVAIESAEFEDTLSSLQFVRTANIDDVSYWLWRSDPSDEYIYVEKYEDSVLISIDDQDDLSPEQFLVKEFLRNQHQVKFRR